MDSKQISRGRSICWVRPHSALENDADNESEGVTFSSLHREDGPAYVFTDNVNQQFFKHWVVNGVRHRIDGPATESNNSTHWKTTWLLHGVLWYVIT